MIGGLFVAMAMASSGVAAEQGAGPGTVAAITQNTSDATVGHLDSVNDYPPERLGYLTSASDLIETPVWDRAGHKLGKIEDFVVDWNSGRVYCVLIWPQNLYGSSNYYVAVPAKCFIAADESRAVINTNLKTLIGSPRFLRTSWEAAAVSNSVAEAYRRFGQPLSWDEKAGPGAVGRYSSLLGVEVNNRANVNIGDLADLALDLPTERIMFAVISFYGEDRNQHAVPFPAVKVASNRQNLVVDVDESKIGALVNPDNFLRVEMTDPLWVADDYSAFGKQPGFDAGEWARLNGAQPVAQATEETPTPVVANRTPVSGDTKLARAVMVAIVQADMANAVLAQNIQIAADNGVVTLRGPVPGEAKKNGLEKIAEGVDGVSRVRNELAVK